jgi:hypothetical protein
MTEAAPPHEARHAAPAAEQRRMWLILLGPPLLWSVRFMLVYVLIEVACRSEFLGFNLLGLAGLSALNLGLGLLTIVVTAWITWVAYGIWREAPEGDEAGLGAAEGRRRTLAVAGVGIGLLMIFVTVLEVLPVFFIAPCGMAP